MVQEAIKKYAATALLAAAALLAPAKAALVCVMALPVVDLALALMVEAQRSKPKTILEALRLIRSSGLKRTVGKVLMYEVATTLAYLTETFLTGDLVPCLKAVTALIGLTELKSCLEHLDALSGSGLFKLLLDKLSPEELKNRLK